jgi:hypothetical protein
MKWKLFSFVYSSSLLRKIYKKKNQPYCKINHHQLQANILFCLYSFQSSTEENLSDKYSNLKIQYDDLHKRFADEETKSRNAEEKLR